MTITVFTPTYNRAYILGNAYESLKAQTHKGFEWLVVDDGSTDGTEELVKGWVSAAGFPIRYINKPNGGVHTAHNLAHDEARGELVFGLDSDDDLAPDCIAIMQETWEACGDKDNLSGMIFNQCYRSSGKLIGTPFPDNVSRATYHDIYFKYGVTGDKTFVFRTDLARRYKYPVLEGEKFIAPDYTYLQIKGLFAVVNKCVYIKEYLEDGYTMNMLNLYAKNPRGFALYHDFKIRQDVPFFVKMKSIVHYTACKIFLGEKHLKADALLPLRLVLLPLAITRARKLKAAKATL